MKNLTPEEIDAHYRETLKGGTIGGAVGLILGTAGVGLASWRWKGVRSLTIPMRAFLATSTGTFCAIISADRYSRAYEHIRRPESVAPKTSSQRLLEQIEAQKTAGERAKDWLRQNRYPIVFGSWVASMGIAFALVHRNPLLTASQKLVQSRVYAQGLTVGVLVASFGLEAFDKTGRDTPGQWEVVRIQDPNNPNLTIEKRIHHERYAGEDQWMDMVEAEEKRLAREKQLLEKGTA